MNAKRMMMILLVAAAAAAGVTSGAATGDGGRDSGEQGERAPEELPDRDRAALVLIEFQNEWLAEDGKLRSLMEDRAQLERAVEGGREALAAAREAGLAVVHTGLVFREGYPELRPARHGLRAAIPEAGTWIEGSRGAAFHEDFEPAAGEIVTRGRTGASGFSGSDLDERLRSLGVETVYLAGFALHVCVESTMRDAHDLGYEVVLLEDASAAFTREQREHVLEHVTHHFGEAIGNGAFRERLGLAGQERSARGVRSGAARE
jgi:nicotinamidase-related amidase